VEKAMARIREVELKIKSIELDIATRRTSIKRLHDQQFETRKNDEFQALGHEIQRYEKEVFGLEDKEIEQMEALDEGKTALKSAQGKLAVTQARVNEELAQLDERLAGINGSFGRACRQSALNWLLRLIKAETLDALFTPLITRRGDCGGGAA
jgi:predicted  nucleic acid-binding Zn-ribbon protein